MSALGRLRTELDGKGEMPCEALSLAWYSLSQPSVVCLRNVVKWVFLSCLHSEPYPGNSHLIRVLVFP